MLSVHQGKRAVEGPVACRCDCLRRGGRQLEDWPGQDRCGGAVGRTLEKNGRGPGNQREGGGRPEARTDGMPCSGNSLAGAGRPHSGCGWNPHTRTRRSQEPLLRVSLIGARTVPKHQDLPSGFRELTAGGAGLPRRQVQAGGSLSSVDRSQTLGRVPSRLQSPAAGGQGPSVLQNSGAGGCGGTAGGF